MHLVQEYLSKIAANLKSRNNLLSQLTRYTCSHTMNFIFSTLLLCCCSCLFCCTCLYALCRDDEVCSSLEEELASTLVVNDGNVLQLDSVDGDIENELDSNENNSSSNSMFIVILLLITCFIM